MNLNENFWKFAALGAVGVALFVALAGNQQPSQPDTDTGGDPYNPDEGPQFGVDFTPNLGWPWNPYNPLPPVRDYNPEDPFGVDYSPDLGGGWHRSPWGIVE